LTNDPITPAAAPPYVQLAAKDNVVVLTRHVDAGDRFAGTTGQAWTMPARLEAGNKLAARTIHAGEKVIKVGVPIGTATVTIEPGSLVHSHNLRSDYIPIDRDEETDDAHAAAK
jgi:hypothetical protein